MVSIVPPPGRDRGGNARRGDAQSAVGGREKGHGDSQSYSLVDGIICWDLPSGNLHSY